MSRRKQAKPRAFLKLGENPENCAGEDDHPTDPLELLDPKEELLSDVDDSHDDDNNNEDECYAGRQQHNDTTTTTTAIAVQCQQHQRRPHEELNNKQKHSPPLDNKNGIGGINAAAAADDASGDAVDDAADIELLKATNAAACVKLSKTLTTKPVLDGSKEFVEILPKTEYVDTINTTNNVDEDTEDNYEDDIYNDDIEEDDDIYDDDEDIHSLDSYYSDMYSTHTSSSYSPSISDGTITPNSLHQHLPTHHQHLQHLQNLQQLHDTAAAAAAISGEDGGALQMTAQRLRRQAAAAASNNNNNKDTPNGGGVDATGDDDEHEMDGHNKNINEATRKANKGVTDGDGVTTDVNVEQLKRQQGRLHRHHHQHAEHAMKIPTKLRKIDRDAAVAAGGGGAAGAKFDKLTADGIKNSNSNADGSYQCQFCDKSFPRLGYLKKHEQSHAEHLPFKCDYCARLFKHKRSRDRHTKLHTGDRRYRCPHCEAAFSRSDHLKIHMKTHDNQKPFQCTICNRGYNTAAALTSHMQNHKKQAAILAAGGNPQALNYSPRSTGSASSNGSLHKRRYAMAIAAADSSPGGRLEYPKRLRASFLNCSYCTKSDFNTLEQLNAHVQAMHEKELMPPAAPPTPNASNISSGGSAACEINAFQLACEYCTMKFPNLPTMFQHMRTTHIDRLTSPNSYFEHFNRLAASGTFSPRLISSKSAQQPRNGSEERHIKIEQATASPKSQIDAKTDEEPTDLSQNKRRFETPNITPQNSPHITEKPGVFFCNQCNAGLPDFESFRNHLKSHIAQGLQLVCHHCGLTLREQSEYERHVIAHFLIANSEYKCAGNCNKTYAKPEELQKHLLDQHAILMYKCSLCSELFDSKVAIQVHFACAHTPETKLLRCSACMEVFRAESDFNIHVKTRHQATNGTAAAANSLQCMFCRTICSSDLEMHFHLAAHARQFRCPSCPETFHVEFLLDRHMQSHHGGNERLTMAGTAGKETFEEHANTATNNAINPMNSLYVNALFGKAAAPLMPVAAQNNNNNILDYNVAFAAHLNKGLFPANAASKFYSPLQVDTNAMKHPALMYGLSQRYFDTSRTLMDMYTHHHQQDKSTVNAASAAAANYFISPKHPPTPHAHQDALNRNPNDGANSTSMAGFSCDICERNDFRTESEVNSHRKIVHNMKTGVSLRCAYCSGNFKSRSELEHHMKTCHNSTGKHKCLICDEIFPSPAILAEHKLQHSKVGQSGKCSHCSKPLNDITAFKGHLSEHNNEGQMPVQCICCRQSLHSDFEIGLHAKFHTKSSNTPESVCALCLEPIPNATPDAKVCEKCCRKHNLNTKYKNRESYERVAEMRHNYVENRCNLCKMILPHQHKLQEHLVEHTFAGCEDRGFICYICSAVFTAPSGLLNHMTEHGLNARPYDCNLCTEKYYFRAELDHHLLEHELRETQLEMREAISARLTAAAKEEKPTAPPQSQPPTLQLVTHAEQQKLIGIGAGNDLRMNEIKQEIFDADNKSNTGGVDDDEYIEVEKVHDINLNQQRQQQQSDTHLEEKKQQESKTTTTTAAIEEET